MIINNGEGNSNYISSHSCNYRIIKEAFIMMEPDHPAHFGIISNTWEDIKKQKKECVSIKKDP